MTRFHDRVAVVTGGSEGIGFAIASRLAAEGATVAICGRREEALQSAASAIKDQGGRVVTRVLDVTDTDALTAVMSATVERFDRLDVLVNNAGAPHGNDRGQVEDVPFDEWQRVMAINAGGVFLMTRAVVPHMKSRGYGRIVSLSSVAGLTALPEGAAYCASKAAVIGFTRSVAHDLAPFGITVNCVCPGSIRTDRAISSTLRAGWTDVEAGLAERAQHIPVRRHGLPEEVAATIAHLAAGEAGFITGQAIPVDGGGLPATAF